MTNEPAAHYSPGDWLAVAVPGLWLLADVRPADPVAAECWDLATGHASLDRIAAALRSAHRPVAFAAARTEAGGVRAIADGAAEAELIGVHGGAFTVRAGRPAPPADEPIAEVRLRGPATRPNDCRATLPITAGTVLAADLTAVLVDAPKPPDVAPPAPPAAGWSPVAEPPAPAEASDDGDPARYDAMLGFADPAAAPVEEFPETVALAPVRLEPEPVGRTTVRPQPRADAQVDGFIDMASLDWLAPASPAPPQPIPASPPPPAAPLAPAAPGAVSWPPGEPVVPAAPLARAALGSASWPPAEPVVPAPAGEHVPDDLILTTARSARAGTPVPGPVLSAVRCPAGHLGDPAARACRVCGAAVPPQAPVRVDRPPLGSLRLSTGDTITLDRNVVLGRAPGRPAGSGADEPHYVKLPSPYHDISRRHVEIRLDGWDVLAVDLDSRNGTFVEQPGERPVELPRGGSCRLRNGAVVGLTEAVSFRFEAAG